MARLEHPFIVPVYDYGEHAGQLFFVMRYMPGGTLSNWAGNRPKPLAEVIPVVERLASALDAVYRRGIIHRDLNPRNVLLDDSGFVFLADFGIAKPPESMTLTGIVGTPEYMSPEQAAGRQDLDGRSDVYSLGVLVYQLLSGEVPYSAATPSGILHQHRHGPLPSLDTDRLGLPVESKMILARALAKQPEAGYASAGEFASTLRVLRVNSIPQANITLTLDLSIRDAWSRLFRKTSNDKAIHTIWSWGDLERLHPAYKRRKFALMLGSITILSALVIFMWWSGRVGSRISGDPAKSLTPIVATFTASSESITAVQVTGTQALLLSQTVVEPEQLLATPTVTVRRPTTEHAISR